MTNARILMLRGINLGPKRRVPMADLRALLSEGGFAEVRTYVQSGNIVCASSQPCPELEDVTRELISQHFGFEVPVVGRTGEELAAVVALNPLGDVATEPKRYQVSFLSGTPDPDAVAALQAAAVGEERLVADGRELYAWHPDGIARSKMWDALAGKGLGVTATARNWRTVLALHDMAQEIE